MVEPHSSNFRVITTIFLGVLIFRKFTVVPDLTEEGSILLGLTRVTRLGLTRAVRGSDYSPAIALSEEKDKLV